MSSLAQRFRAYITQNADIQAHHIKAGKIGYGADGQLIGNAYTPALMKYDGSAGRHYINSFTPTGNKVRALILLQKTAVGTGGGSDYVFHYRASNHRLLLTYTDSDNPNTNRRNRFQVFVQSNVGATLWRGFGFEGAGLGSQPIVVYVGFDGDGPGAVLRVGTTGEDTSNPDRGTPTVGTLQTGPSPEISVGSDLTPSNYWDGHIGFFALDDSYDADYTQYIHDDGTLKNVDLSSWKVFNPHGDLRDNRGTLGNFTLTNTVVVGDAGAT